MSLALLSTLSLFVLILYFSTKRNLHSYEQCLVFFIVILVYLTFLSIIDVNLHLIELSHETVELIAFRLYGVIFVPFTFLWIYDKWQEIKENLFHSVILFLSFLMLLYIGDYILRFYDVYQFNVNGSEWLFVSIWIAMFVFILFLQKWYKLCLRKEGRIL